MFEDKKASKWSSEEASRKNCEEFGYKADNTYRENSRAFGTKMRRMKRNTTEKLVALKDNNNIIAIEKDKILKILDKKMQMHNRNLQRLIKG